jgi:putative flippase GtrA
MIRHFFTRQFALFLFVGGTAALLNWVSRMAFSLLFSFSVAVVFAYMIGMAAAFTLNRLFVFHRSERPIAKQARDFVLINLCFMPIVLIVSVSLEKLLWSFGIEAYPQVIAHGFAVSLPAILSFLFYKFVAFKEA